MAPIGVKLWENAFQTILQKCSSEAKIFLGQFLKKSKILAGRLPPEDGSDRRETLGKRVSEDFAKMIFRGQNFFGGSFFEKNQNFGQVPPPSPPESSVPLFPYPPESSVPTPRIFGTSPESSVPPRIIKGLRVLRGDTVSYIELAVVHCAFFFPRKHLSPMFEKLLFFL